ncbi:MAG: hypothetical protein CSB13_07725 [Chloroflexi bacterium]|nr:MAG: hypothetical protein CSB13_07725 [Chloroflexota bacterium]
MDSAYQLIVQKGPQPGQIYPLLSTSITLGRDPITDIVLNDPEVSRQHARLTQTANSYQIEDLQSTNGTYVNGTQVRAKAVPLAHGAEIQLGSGVLLIFELMPEDDDDDEEVSIETAVAASLPEELKSDPMLTPEFDRLAVIDNLPATPSPENTPDIQEELNADRAKEEHLPSLPEIPEAPVPPQPSSPPPTPPQKGSNRPRRFFAISTVLILLMVCCCGFLFFMYQWGGDWLLQQMELIP